MAKTSRTKKTMAGEGKYSSVKTAWIREVQTQLLVWYRAHRRDLPWRKETPDPYHVMVSEAMLQQTQVATVIGYFNRFIEALPTVHALAAAEEQQVLTLWQGLGYYRRARGLHAAAKLIVQEHAGQVPNTVDKLLKLPGVGRYTAGAIASIAHGLAAPIIDGNVARVLCRLRAIREPADDPQVRDQLWGLAAALVPGDAAGDFNQSMMELGALVCLPRQPQCLICPIASHCEANRLGLVDELPVKVARRKPVAVAHHVVAIQSRGQWLFEQRPGVGLWSNMWQLPTAEELSLPALAGDATTVIQSWLHETRGLSVEELHEVNSFRHQTTHRTIQFTLWRGKLVGRRPGLRENQSWRKLNDLADLPMSNPQKTMIRTLQ